MTHTCNDEHSLPTIDRRIDQQMQVLMDQYLPGRSPVSLSDYDWQTMRPDTVDQDILDALTFVTMVECNPGDPASKLLAAADRDNAPWLRRFIDETWLPEELTHHVPYKEYLLRSGALAPESLNARIQDVRSRGFGYGEGYTALQAATYGWIQELITWRFYEAMRSHLLARGKEQGQSDPVLIKMLGDIAKQENFHRHIYLSGVKAILRHAPERKAEMIRALAEFIMPGHHMAPDLQPRSAGWAARFNLSARGMIREIASGVVDVIGYKGLGQTASLYGRLHSTPWYVKALATILRPQNRWYGSPMNTLAGRLITRFV